MQSSRSTDASVACATVLSNSPPRQSSALPSSTLHHSPRGLCSRKAPPRKEPMKLVNVATAPGSSHAHTPTMVVGCLKPCAPTALQSRCAGFGGRPCRRVKRRRVCAPGATEEEEGAGALAELQRKLEVGRGAQERSEEKRMEYEAVQLAETLQQSGEARNFGRGEQVATASARQEVLRLNGIEKRRLVERKGREAPRLPQLAGSLLLSSLFLVAGTAGEADAEELILLAAGFAGLWLVDQAALGGTGQLVLTDALARASPSLRERVAYHEAGHFLVGYLMGRLPKAYALGSLDALRNGALPAQGGTAFCDAALEDEVARGRVASNTVREVGAIALAGVCAEYVRFGDAEGGKDDIATLDGLYRSLGFSQRSTDFEVTWSVLNDVLMLRRNAQALAAVANAMRRNASVSCCIAALEQNL